jgi:ribonuclease HII
MLMLKLKINSDLLECGTDEAGRGCLAGPVTAAACILPDDFAHPLLKDSKQLNHNQREQLRELIESSALAWAVAHVSEREIDQMNILNASITAMHRAIMKLNPMPEFIAVDGNRFKPLNKIPYQCVVKGDAKYQHIAAASILAKTERDRHMASLDKEYPQYDWCNNKGYPTAKHRAAIAKFGDTPYHRKTFRLLPNQLKLSF